ncbi:hypothetical protein [Candidatus Pristimantibacillus sp. PTI5]|uniref:hypothetical protein n=1 Tax=Candidatus Pristimantibacillus sp. PTI5 TaxID=3400422 RepID=UPI003B01A5DC
MNKRIKLILGGALLVVAFTVFIFSYGNSSTNASQASDKEIESILRSFFKSIDDKNVDNMIDNTIDIRFSDDEVRKTEYNELLSTDKVKLKDIVSIKKIDDNNYIVTANINTKDNGDIINEFPVTLDEEKWKVIIGQDYIPNN